MIIREAKKEDIPEILRVTKAAFTIYSQNMKMHGRLAALDETEKIVEAEMRYKTIFIAEEADKIIASIRFHELAGDIGYITRLAVDPEVHNSGIGKKLIERTAEICKEDGIKFLALHTDAKMAKNACFYYKLGFYIHSTYFDRGYVRGLFVKELTDVEIDEIKPKHFGMLQSL